MDSRGDKVAYYCSELGNSRQNTNENYSQHISNNNSNNNNNNNNNSGSNNNILLTKSSLDSNKAQQGIRHDSEQNCTSDANGGQSLSNSGDYPRAMNRFNPTQQIDSHSVDQSQQLGGRTQFVHNHILTAPHHQTSQATATNSAQPQYLISSSNPQHMTNLTPHHYNQQQNSASGASNTNSSAFQVNSVNSTASYHINSNHHLYQSGMVQQMAQQSRTPLFQPHHRSPSQGDTDNINSKIQNNPVIFQDGSSRNQLINQEHHMNRVQISPYQPHHQVILNNEQSPSVSLTTSQSMTHNDFNRLRRQSEQPNVTNDINIEGLNLDFEAMLMNEGQKNNTNSNDGHLMQKQHLQSGQDINRMLRTLVNQHSTGDSTSCGAADKHNSDMSSSGYGRPSQQEMVRPSKDSLFMQDNTEDNIYEEIDIKAINRLQADYPIDTISLHSDTWKKKNSKKFLGASFTRWFSTRKKSSNSQNSDQEENPYDSKSNKRPRLISLPEPIPDNLTPEKLKRRLIVGSVVDSENSYTNSLYRLIYEYKKPLEEADPPILSPNKISIIFFCLEQILQFHRIFGFALNHYVQEWDEKEMIGSVFTINFSKPMVLDIYSGFINNFTNAMETARRASKSKAFAQFLHDKSIASPDRLSFFGSMVKPVQRFPQFILLLSDLLKHTPFNHPDRMPLQTALTELESLADRLNERKRDAERHFAVKQLLKDHLNESNAHSQRFLLRQDDTCLLDMDPSTNSILKSKNRKMYLLNDMLICVSTPSNRLKFAVPLSDITVIESITPAISNILAHSNLRNLGDPNGPSSPQNYTIERMECERQSLAHDLEIMTRIAALVASLRFQYNGLNPLVPEQICLGIRDEIRKKEFQMTLIDRSCLQLRLHSKNNRETLVVQFSSPDSKRDWLIDVRLTKLALDRANNPGWENVADNPPPTHQASLCSIGQRVPLFVKSLAIFKLDQSYLTCALHYYLRQAPFIGENPAGVLWICNVNAAASSLGALATDGAEVSLIHSFELSDSHVTCLESVGSTLWIGLRQGRIIVIDANSPSVWVQFASLDVQAEVTCVKYYGHFVYVGLITGTVAVFDAINFDKPYLIQLSQVSVTCILPVNGEVLACSHNKIWRIKETNIVDSLLVQNDTIIPLEEEPRPNLLAHCGSGLWVSLVDSPIVKLYHAETLKHLQDINVGMSIRRVLNDFKDELKVTVTSMMATRGLLWIGTNVGMIATLTLPRLQGVPLVSGSINVALHRFLGPVNIMLNLSAGLECVPQVPFNDNSKQQSLRSNHQMKNEDAEAIYGQYADLMNVGDYITSNRKSGGLSDTPATSMAWEFGAAGNLAGLNVSDDSHSSASSGAIYQDGVPRGMKQVQNKAVVSNAVQIDASQLQSTIGPNSSIPPMNQIVTNSVSGLIQTNQVADISNHNYDKTGQTAAYNQGSLNGVTTSQTNSNIQPTAMSEGGLSMDRSQHQQSQLSTSQTHLASVGSDQKQANTAQQQNQVDYGSHSVGKLSSKIYDQPAQMIQQQQIIQQSRQMNNQIDGNMLNNMQSRPIGYGTVGKLSKGFMCNKTVLVLAGGNGYQRMALGDNEPFGKDAHCIIWEYKA